MKNPFKFDYSWLDDDIIYFKYHDNVLIQEADVEAMLKLQHELGVNQDTIRIIYAGKYTTITSEARQLVEREKPKAKAEAYILTSLAQRILFNLYKKVRGDENPIRAFSSVEAAIKWARKISAKVNS